VGQHAGLRGDLLAGDQLVEQLQQPHQLRHAVGRGVDADHRVAGAIHQAVDDAGQDAGRAVGRVVGLQPHRQRAGQAQRVAEAGDDATLAGHQDEVLVAHDLAGRGHHLGRQAGGQRGERRGGRGRRQQPVAQAAHREMAHRREGRGVVAVDDQARDLVVLVGHDGVGEEGGQRQVGQRGLGGDALLRRLRRDAGQPVAGARGAGLAHQLAQVGEAVDVVTDGGAVAHSNHDTATR